MAKASCKPFRHVALRRVAHSASDLSCLSTVFFYVRSAFHATLRMFNQVDLDLDLVV